MKNRFFETYIQDYQTGKVLERDLYSSLAAAKEGMYFDLIYIAKANGYNIVDIEIIQKTFTSMGTLTTTIKGRDFAYKVGRCIEIPEDETKLKDLIDTIFKEK